MQERTDIGMRLGSRRSAAVWIAVALLATVGVLALWLATRESGDEVAGAEPAALEPLEGSSLVRVRLTERAAERIDLKTTPVRDVAPADRGKPKTVVPYSAVLYDTAGKTWVYTSPEPLAFVRAPVEVERFDGSLAFLTDGPPAGTPVVSVGAALLLGAELGVDH
jgi:hypothetical protein